jgi:NAD dependent epimerase/dehydratase family enzyme
MAATVLEGANPDPSRIQSLGFRFRYADVESALSAELSSD